MIEGNVEDGLLMAGQSVGSIREIKTAKEIIAEVMTEAETQIARLRRHMN